MTARFSPRARAIVAASAIALAGSAVVAWPSATQGPAGGAGTRAGAGAGADACADCHRGLHPELVRAHEQGPHAGKASCADCHGSDHAAIFSSDGEVSSARCGSCHAARAAEFARSKHGRLLKGGAVAETLRAHSRTVGGCASTNGCHDVQRQNADGSVGRCASCHVGHAFARGQASDPAVCARCHSGPDHPQWEAWSNDKHGVLWRQAPGSGLAPSCATCHMPDGRHDDGAGLTVAVVARAGQAKPTLVPTMTGEAHAAARGAMLAVCARCHGKRLAEETLAAGDEARLDGLLLCEEAAQVVRDLDAEGLLVPSPADRPRNPASDGGLALGARQIYDDASSRAERLFYDMFMFDWPALWRAAYHTDPNLVRWTARERLKSDLIEIRAEAERLRAARRAGK
jgi:hypothetical protein